MIGQEIPSIFRYPTKKKEKKKVSTGPTGSQASDAENTVWKLNVLKKKPPPGDVGHSPLKVAPCDFCKQKKGKKQKHQKDLK